MSSRKEDYDYYHRTTLGSVFFKSVQEQGLLRALGRMMSFAKDLIVGRLLFLKKRRVFLFDGLPFQYFYARYNKTWKNERAVEIPVFLQYLAQHHGKVLEVGQVLKHYASLQHEVLDKYERGAGILNEDAVHFVPQKKYDCVVSVSTMEHVGVDDNPVRPQNAVAALKNIQRQYLTPQGKLFISFPANYNLALMQCIRHSRNIRCWYFRRFDRKKNLWKQATFEDIRSVKGLPPEAVIFVEFIKKSEIRA